MPRLSQSVPKLRCHKASGQAFVELGGVRHYLGRHGTKASRLEYDRRVGEWLQNGRAVRSPSGQDGDLLVVELIAAYLRHAQSYYRQNGRLTSEYAAIVHAMRPLKELYGRQHVTDFGPIALQTVMARMVDEDWARTTVNRQAGRIRRMIRWGVAQELFPASIHQALQAVDGLRKGRTAAREPEPVLPVSAMVVAATLPHLPEVVQVMVRFQQLTGCRPAEVCSLRPADLNRDGEVWLYVPAQHKTSHHGRQRTIFVGPRAQSILLKYLVRDPEMHCFRPVDSEAKRRAAAHAARVTPTSCGDVPGSNRRRKPKRCPGERYDVAAYRRSIARGCDKAFPHPALAGIRQFRLTADRQSELRQWQTEHRWSPNQLRHSAGTEIRRRFGVEGAQILLGHSRADVTQVYAERDMKRGIEIARRIG